MGNVVGTEMGTFFKKTKVILLLILAAAAFLRLWNLDKVPVSLFSDELDVGYQAYSILKTGKDYFGNPWPIHFQAYADVRTPLYIYSSVPSVAAFGITAWGLRLPASFFGILGVFAIFLLVAEISKSERLGLFAASLLALSSWHIQYSRAAFEATMLLAFMLFGLYFFFKSINSQKGIWKAVLLLVLTPYIYSTAKLFVPALLIFLFFLYKRQLLKLPSPELVKATVAGLVVGVPIVISTLFGGGAHRFGYLSVFTDPTTESQSSYARLTDVQAEGPQRGLFQKVESYLIHNKYTYWLEKVSQNYFKSFSTEFLFVEGDLNLRHSISGVGQFYKVEALGLILGMILFFVFFKDRRIRAFVAFWILVGAIPSAITRDGAAHASRLILILPPLTFLIAYGFIQGVKLIPDNLRSLSMVGLVILFAINFWSYQHNFWVHNPWNSQRPWNAGYSEMIEMAKRYEGVYEKIIISNADQPPQIFFAAYYPVDPELWQKGLSQAPIEGFGVLPNLRAFYFGQVGEEGLKGLSKVLAEDTIYIAAAREWEANLLRQPGKAPEGLRLVGSVSFPSGEPAFYALVKEEN